MMIEIWSSFLWLVGLLFPLLWFKREINRRLLHVGWLLFQNEQAAVLLYFLIMLPGVLLHELSHLAMAALLGVPAGGLTIWPKVQRDGLQLGSVQVARTDMVRESLIGLAPLLAGSLAVLLIAGLVFDVPLQTPADPLYRLLYVVNHADQLLSRANAMVWLYLIFAISNAMLPSPSDRQPWRTLLLFLAILGGVILIINGGPPQLPDGLLAGIHRAIDLWAMAFAFTLLVDLVFLTGIFLAEQLLWMLRSH